MVRRLLKEDAKSLIAWAIPLEPLVVRAYLESRLFPLKVGDGIPGLGGCSFPTSLSPAVE
jgi:hypothetical protein